MGKLKYIAVPLTALALIFAFAVFAIENDDDDDDDGSNVKTAKPGSGPVKALEQALKRLEKVENFEFKTESFEAGNVPTTLSINPQGKVRITNGKVTAVSEDRISVEIWKLSFTVHKMPDTKVFAVKTTELAFGDIKVGDIVNVLGALDSTQTAFVHAEVIHNSSQSLKNREEEIARLRGLIEDLIRQLQEILARTGRPLPPGFSPLPSPSASPSPTPLPSPSPIPTP